MRLVLTFITTSLLVIIVGLPKTRGIPRAMVALLDGKLLKGFCLFLDLFSRFDAVSGLGTINYGKLKAYALGQTYSSSSSSSTAGGSSGSNSAPSLSLPFTSIIISCFLSLIIFFSY
jgi:hypothetical protein